MTIQANQTKVEKDKTTVGNFFVSNYPPYSFWKPEMRDEAFNALEQTPSADTQFGMYLHIPFCRQRCHFCYFRVYTGKDATKTIIDDYLDALKRELDYYADKPLLAGRKPKFVYFGGGTPSYLNERQLADLFETLKSRFPWVEAEEIAFECEPGTLNERKLEALRDAGVSRISLGIENFDDAILQANNRAHLSKEIHRAYDYAREIGFNQINIDLIAGMINETEENWKRNIEKTLEFQPDCVTIYQMEIPFNTHIYKEMKEKGDVVAPVADWPTKRRWTMEAYERLEEAGYTITSAYTAVRDPEQYKFRYRDYLWEGADMLSLGVSSFGYLNGTHYQNEKDMGPYIERVNADDPPIYRAYTMNDEERLIRELILKMKIGVVERDYFRQKFGVDVVEKFKDAFHGFVEEGHLTVDDRFIKIHRESMLIVDTLLHDLFLPQHRDARYT